MASVSAFVVIVKLSISHEGFVAGRRACHLNGSVCHTPDEHPSLPPLGRVGVSSFRLAEES